MATAVNDDVTTTATARAVSSDDIAALGLLQATPVDHGCISLLSC